MLNKSTFDFRIFVLMLLIIIEIMGVGIIFPMLPELFINKNSVFSFISNTTDSIRHIFYGASISLWSLGIFFGAPYLGALSDKFGRKKIFLLTLSMTSVCYALLAVAIYLKSLLLFLLGRTLSGFFAGNYEIAQAAAADMSTPETKARNMGWITFAFGTGFAIGPLITSFTAGQTSILSLGITTPLWIASILALVNLILIAFLFTETFQPVRKIKIGFNKMFSAFLFVFTDKRLIFLSVIFFCLTFAWVLFFTGIPLYLSDIFNLTTKYIGLFYCLIGISNIVTILMVQKYILKKLTLKNIIVFTASISAIVLLFLAVRLSLFTVGILIVIFSIAELLAYSSLLAVYSNAVTKEEQGIAMGGTAAIGSLTFILASPVTAILATITIKLAVILSAVFFALSAMLTVKSPKVS